MREIKIPQLGVNDESATLVEWVVENKDKIKVNQEICEIETTKTTISIESPYEGYLLQIVKAKEEVNFQQTIAVVLDSLEETYTPKQKIDEKEKNNDMPISPTNRYTKKAYDYAIKHDINIDMINKKRGIIRESDVIEYIDSGKITPLQSKDISTSKRREKASVKGVSVAIYGTGLGGKMVFEYLNSLMQYNVKYFINDFISTDDKSELYGIPIIHGSEIIKNKKNIDAIACFIANNSFRLSVLEICKKLNIIPISIISPNAIIRSNTKLGKGVFIKDGAVIGSFCSIGNGTIVDDNVTVAHHTNINGGCFLAPGSSIGGGVTIGSKSIVAVGASIVSKVSIGENVIISAGSAVHNDVPDNSIVEGNPAKIIGKRKD